MSKLLKTLRNPNKVVLHIIGKRFFGFIPDSLYLRIRFFLKTGQKLNLENPKSFNEKLQWLKIHDRKPVYVSMVDKYDAKEYVASIIGHKYIIPTLGIYESFDDIDFEKLPNQFVIKCTHDSGGLVIVKDKNQINKTTIRKIINKSLKRNYYYGNREWPYKDVKPRIIIEKFMEDKQNKTMRDYKFFCFNGKPEIMYLSEGLEDHNTARMSFYDMEMELTDCERSDYKTLEYKPEKPKNFEKMKQFSAILSKDIPHLRVDWYEINGKLYFGELTFTTCGGIVPFKDVKWDKKLGDMIDLRIDENNKK